MRHIFKQYSYSQFGHILCKKQTSYTKLYSKTLISTQKRATFFLLSQCTLCGAWLSGGRHGMVCVIPQQWNGRHKFYPINNSMHISICRLNEKKNNFGEKSRYLQTYMYFQQEQNILSSTVKQQRKKRWRQFHTLS